MDSRQEPIFFSRSSKYTLQTFYYPLKQMLQILLFVVTQPNQYTYKRTLTSESIQVKQHKLNLDKLRQSLKKNKKCKIIPASGEIMIQKLAEKTILIKLQLIKTKKNKSPNSEGLLSALDNSPFSASESSISEKSEKSSDEEMLSVLKTEIQKKFIQFKKQMTALHEYFNEKQFFSKKYSKVKWVNGTYYGQLKDRRPHGKGIFFFKQKKQFRIFMIKGSWENGVKNGGFIVIYNNGKYEYCEIWNGKRHGKSILQTDEGRDEREFQDNQLEGEYRRYKKKEIIHQFICHAGRLKNKIPL